MGLIRVSNPRSYRLLKLLLGIFSFEFSEDNRARGKCGGATTFFTQKQAQEIAVRIGYTQGHKKIHDAMWQEGLTDWQKIAERLNQNGQELLTLTKINNIGNATAIEIVHYGLREDLLWFEN